MVVHTRLDCVLGAAAGMRVAVEQATHHAAHRLAFGRLLADQPLMLQRARRPLPRVGGGDRDRPSPRPRVRPPRRRRRARGRLRAHRHGGREVLGLQARPGARGRGARVPRRQRLRRGVGAAAALPPAAAALDLGGLGQRRLPRRAARGAARAGGGRRRCSTRSGSPATRGATAARRGGARAASTSPPPASPSSGSRSRSRPRCSSATRPPRSPTLSARPGSPAGGLRLRHAARRGASWRRSSSGIVRSLTETDSRRLNRRRHHEMLIPVPPSECMRAREAASGRLDDELTELEAARLDAAPPPLSRLPRVRRRARPRSRPSCGVRRSSGLRRPALAPRRRTRRLGAAGSRLRPRPRHRGRGDRLARARPDGRQRQRQRPAASRRRRRRATSRAHARTRPSSACSRSCRSTQQQTSVRNGPDRPALAAGCGFRAIRCADLLPRAGISCRC